MTCLSLSGTIGIQIEATSGVEVNQGGISQCATGLQVHVNVSGNFNVASGVTFKKNTLAILNDTSSGTGFYNNIITDGTTGIKIAGGANNIVTGNQFAGLTNGIIIDNSVNAVAGGVFWPNGIDGSVTNPYVITGAGSWGNVLSGPGGIGNPTVSGCGTIGTHSTNWAGFITAPTGACTPVLTFWTGQGPASTGWTCFMDDLTGTPQHIYQASSTTTTATFATVTTVSGDVLKYICMPY